MAEDGTSSLERISRKHCNEQARAWERFLRRLYEGCMFSAKLNGNISMGCSVLVIVLNVLVVGSSMAGWVTAGSATRKCIAHVMLVCPKHCIIIVLCMVPVQVMLSRLMRANDRQTYTDNTQPMRS
jgi:hypothetical protein